MMRSAGWFVVGIVFAGAVLPAGPARAASKTASKGSSDAKRRAASPREGAPDRDQQIADLRKQAKALAEREKLLESDIAARKKQLASPSERASKTTTGPLSLAEQRAATSATLVLQRQAQADLAGRLTQLHAALFRQGLEQRTRLLSPSEPRESLAIHLTALQTEAAERERTALADAIGQTEQLLQQIHQTVTQTKSKPRTAVTTTGDRAAEIARLEKELDKVRSDRKALLARLESLGTGGKSSEKDRAVPESRSPSPKTTPSKRSSGQPTAAKPTPGSSSVPRATPPPGVREGAGVDLMVSEGTEIHAIGEGEVIYAGRFKGYGNLVIIEHPDKILSLYGFLNQIQVASGATVARGRVIGQSGFIEDKDRAGFRFEMRQPRGDREVLIDPRSWLPKGADLQRRLLRGTD
jgi:murein DD-endopeptidase MepM/ murein hydrolase activator NlpD